MAYRFSVLEVRMSDGNPRVHRRRHFSLQDAYLEARQIRRTRPGTNTFVDRSDLFDDPDYVKNATNYVLCSYQRPANV
jgi:hypothetical protein